MTVTAASFVVDFPEFADATLYPVGQINFWLTAASLLLPVARWTTLLDLGTELYVAHNLVIERKAQAEAANGAPPGVSTGPIANKSVDKASVGYDTTTASVEDAGHWNLTTFGTRFISLARMVGAGPIQVGLPGCLDPLSSSNAWPGPFSGGGWWSV